MPRFRRLHSQQKRNVQSFNVFKFEFLGNASSNNYTLCIFNETEEVCRIQPRRGFLRFLLTQTFSF